MSNDKTPTINAELYPNTAHAIATGVARIGSDGQVTGRASDGSEVLLGSIHGRSELRGLEAYLTSNPEPCQW